jgi:hypothetical protein
VTTTAALTRAMMVNFNGDGSGGGGSYWNVRLERAALKSFTSSMVDFHDVGGGSGDDDERFRKQRQRRWSMLTRGGRAFIFKDGCWRPVVQQN